MDFPLVQGRVGDWCLDALSPVPNSQNKTGTLALMVLYVDNRDALGWTLGKAGPLSV